MPFSQITRRTTVIPKRIQHDTSFRDNDDAFYKSAKANSRFPPNTLSRPSHCKVKHFIDIPMVRRCVTDMALSQPRSSNVCS